ncbi:MAG: tetrathionate reductase family octaheme c-type cytochrome [Bacteroidales bacterium]|nr:tetrathionate reductase family octaheme c-type cytochrome [Bacteroidales bacterium]
MKTTTTLIIAFFFGSYIYAQEDHAEFIEGPFSSPREVTETCLLCHEDIDKDIMKTSHWTWSGKQHSINNYCIAVTSNWPRCTSCHIGFGWKDETFDFTDGNNIDCLICHDQTGTYKKVPTGAGMPDPSVDLVKVAQSVGRTTINNCAICHFNGGGGTGVKHGDLDGSMLNPSPTLDVHMGQLGFSCSDCHAGENHLILGASHGSMATGTNHISCLDCHDEKPHLKKIVNDHVSSVACETCHIPSFARKEPTITWWDWSTAGQDKEVEPDEFGKPAYSKKKGDFTWGKNIVPVYSWHNGQADYYQLGDKMDPEKILELNTLTGSIKDEGAKISPFKVMRGKQIYDSKHNYVIIPKLYGEGGYWKTYDWSKASALGMEESNMDYSGQYDFVETAMYWPINHMVAPARQALKCTACHTQKESKRLNWEQLGYKGDPMRTGGRSKEQ